METQSQTEEDPTTQPEEGAVSFDTIYDFFVGADFGDPADNESEAFLPAFTGLVKRIKEDGVQDCFLYTHTEHAEGNRCTYTSITEEKYFVWLTIEYDKPKKGFYTAKLEINQKPLILGQRPTARPSKVLPYLIKIFGLITQAKEKIREE